MDFELVKKNHSLDLFENSNKDLLNLLNKHTVICLNYDEFEETKTIKFLKIGYGISEYTGEDFYKAYFKLFPSKDTDAYSFFSFSFVNHNGFIYLDVKSRGTGLSLAKGDYIIVLFENQIKKKYIFTKSRSGNEYVGNNILPIDISDLKLFLNENILKIKSVSSRKDEYSIFELNEKENIEFHEKYGKRHFHFQYTTKEAGQLLLRYMTYKFIEFNMQNKI